MDASPEEESPPPNMSAAQLRSWKRRQRILKNSENRMSMVSGGVVAVQSEKEEEKKTKEARNSSQVSNGDELLDMALDDLDKQDTALESKDMTDSLKEDQEESKQESKQESEPKEEKALWEKKWEASLKQAEKDEEKAVQIIERVNTSKKETIDAPNETGLRQRITGSDGSLTHGESPKEQKKELASESKETKALRQKLRRAKLASRLRFAQIAIVILYALLLSYFFLSRQNVSFVSKIPTSFDGLEEEAEASDEVLIDLEKETEPLEFLQAVLPPPPLSGWLSVPLTILVLHLVTYYSASFMIGASLPFHDPNTDGMITKAIRNFGGRPAARALQIQKFIFLCVNDFFLFVFIFVLSTAATTAIA
mmetsp:Transcript_16266/g.21380  ORF Transcript_16266/g.21380 Transcript_16266/m.21380 type:complete len:366 (+) Transcript_16266:209-1306(+)